MDSITNCLDTVAVFMCGNSVLQVFQRFWDAALQGNAAAVSNMLHNYGIPINARHLASNAHVVLRIADVRTRSPEFDKKLRDVLEVLFNAEWTPSVRRNGSQANALHLLANQGHIFCVQGRAELLVQTQLRHPQADNMLTAQDIFGMMPEDLAAGHSQALRSRLYQARTAISQALQQTR